MKFFVYIKNDSKRVYDKNFIKLGDKPLWHHVIDTLKPHHIYIDTDSQRVMDGCKNRDYITAYKRDEEHIRLENDHKFSVSPVPLMINRFLDTYIQDEHELIVTPHVTSPFLRLDTIMNACTYMHQGYDTVQSCTFHHEFCYYKGKPVNFNPSVIQKTQDLEPVVMGNGAFFIFTKETFKRHNNRTGINPYFYPLSYREAVEIDTLQDYDLAKRYI